jgi:hypothetical protein
MVGLHFLQRLAWHWVVFLLSHQRSMVDYWGETNTFVAAEDDIYFL